MSDNDLKTLKKVLKELDRIGKKYKKAFPVALQCAASIKSISKLGKEIEKYEKLQKYIKEEMEIKKEELRKYDEFIESESRRLGRPV